MPLQDFPAHELLPHGLSPDQLQNPYTVIERFFDMSHIPDIRKDFRDIFDMWTAGGNFHKWLNKRDRNNLVHTYRRMEQLIEAVYCLHLQKEGKINTEEVIKTAPYLLTK